MRRDFKKRDKKNDARKRDSNPKDASCCRKGKTDKANETQG
jgi:hypothetical protein